MDLHQHTISLELDAATAHLLIHLAQIWGVTEQEAIRRAIEHADTTHQLAERYRDQIESTKERSFTKTIASDRLDAFRQLQSRLNLTEAQAIHWQETIREARR